MRPRCPASSSRARTTERVGLGRRVTPPPSFSALAFPLAAAFLAGEWERGALIERARAALDPPAPWVAEIADEVLAAYHRRPRDRPRELTRFIELKLAAATLPPPPPRARRLFVFEQEMGRRRWPVAQLDTLADLAALLGLSGGQLDWLADVRGMERRVEAEGLRNYRYLWLHRPGGPPRAIERPKAGLKAAQRLVLREILDRIPAHPSSHGFVGGRSARSHAAEHTGRGAVLRFDLEDFFASVQARRVFGIFRVAGYAEGVAHRLTGLCTNVVPLSEWSALERPREARAITAHWRLGSRLATPHLPQGAPTSPALANLAAFSLDRRMGGLAAKVGARYTRYADDLVLSGPPGLASRADRLSESVAEIAQSEGFRLNERKTRVMSAAGRQQVGGVVVNEHPNVTRESYDALKATIHNAVRHGLEAENRSGHPDFAAHLLGRIAWVEQLNPARGRKLRQMISPLRPRP